MKHIWPYRQIKNKSFFKDGKKRAVVEVIGNKVKVTGDRINKILSLNTGKTVRYSQIEFV